MAKGIRKWLNDDPCCLAHVHAATNDECGQLTVWFSLNDGTDVAEVCKEISTEEQANEALDSIERIRHTLRFLSAAVRKSFPNLSQ